MAKYLALIIPAVLALTDVFSGQLSAFVAAHPQASVLLSAIGTIVAALTKSVIPPKE